MDDAQIFSRIKELVDEEHALTTQASDADRHARRQHLEEQLDMCWDLLRQRQARREFHQNPEGAHERPVGEVEGYLQ